MVVKVCKWCGSDFESQHNRKMYCSEDCRREGYREMTRLRVKRYRSKYPSPSLGTGALSSHMRDNVDVESRLVHHEKLRLYYAIQFG